MMNYAVKEIKDYNGKYAVDADGEVYTMKNGEYCKMKKKIQRDGYYYITLCLDGKKKTHAVHRLVATAFLGDV